MEDQSVSKKQPNYVLFFAISCIGFDFWMLVLPFLFYDLGKNIDFYFALYILEYSYYALIGFTILSVIYLLFQIKKGNWKRSLPFWLNGVTLFILMMTPYRGIAIYGRMQIELQINKTKYQEIIRRVDSGELQPMDEKGTIRLPAALGNYVSANKNHAVTSVFFDIGTGFGDPQGFMYRSNDTLPPSDLMVGYWIDCKREELDWYFCSSTN